jgi:uncharacterized repeat protein (TIGR03803 family)
MKTRITNLSLVRLLTAVVGLTLAGQVTAQTFTILHSFLGGTDRAEPNAGLTLSSNILYGTTYWAASSTSSIGFVRGTVFSIHTDGEGFTNLHTFPALGNDNTSSEGTGPVVGLTLSGNTLYGTAGTGGTSGSGTVFYLKTDGSGFAVLHNFTALSYPVETNSDGSAPESELVLSGDTLYGRQ